MDSIAETATSVVVMNAPVSAQVTQPGDATSHSNTFLSSVTTYWKKQAYRHKNAEKLMYLMFLSGLLLWDWLAVPWGLERWLLLAHMVVGMTVFLWVVGLFWSAHRKLLLRSKNDFLKLTGRLTEVLLGVCVASGVYLFFYGVTGDTVSVLIQSVHFYSSLLLTPLVFRHAFRWSVLNLKAKFIKWFTPQSGGAA
jgi:hypothetical protein